MSIDTIETESQGTVDAHAALWTDAVMQIADRVHRAFPNVLKGRIEAATALALAPGKVKQDSAGSWHVAASKGGWYEVNGKCTCQDYPRAHEGWCKHRTAVGIVRRARELAIEDIYLDPEEFFSEHEEEPEAEPPMPESAEPVKPPQHIPPQYIQMVHGKPFVLYAGLLHMANERGLVKLEAKFISVTAELALAKATATFADGRVFTEAADATPKNVNAGVAKHYARCALTRAKARALRDALELEMCAVEEIE